MCIKFQIGKPIAFKIQTCMAINMPERFLKVGLNIENTAGVMSDFIIEYSLCGIRFTLHR